MALQGIHWLGHASFRLEGTLTVYIDPWKLKGTLPADLILITHAHHDHLSVEDIARIAHGKTVIVCPPSCVGQLAGDVRMVKPGDMVRLEGVTVEAVPAYNTNKPNHPKTAGNVGYIVEMDGRRVYHAGDTDLIPEMAGLCCDVALLPIGGTYTMNADEAAEAVQRIMPRVVVPMHWGDIVGSERDVKRFQKRLAEMAELKGVEVAAPPVVVVLSSQ